MVKCSSRFKSVAGLDMEIGSRLVEHAGLGVLGEFCDAVGLGEALSRVLPYQGPGEAVYDRGALLVQMMLVTAGGGEACSDMSRCCGVSRRFSGMCLRRRRCTGLSLG